MNKNVKNLSEKKVQEEGFKQEEKQKNKIKEINEQYPKN